MGEFKLRCNNLECRTSLSKLAIVTTCSHVFCVECANTLFKEPKCPACETVLTEADDVMSTNLQPTEDYKTSVLSGLSPAIIMDICSRAMSFWTYQANQEITFQEHVGKHMHELTVTMKHDMEAVKRDSALKENSTQEMKPRTANGSAMQDKLANAINEAQHEKACHEEVVQALDQKTKQLFKLQHLYDRVKRMMLTSPLKRAAIQSVDAAMHRLGSQAAKPENTVPLSPLFPWQDPKQTLTDRRPLSRLPLNSTTALHRLQK